MSTSRRDFLKKGTVVALAAGVPIGLATEMVTAATGSTSAGPKLANLNKAAFAAHLNSEFVFKNGGANVKTKLIDVSDLRRHTEARPGKEGFSLLFRGERSRPLKQNTYLIEHAKLGSFSFLVVPTMSKDKGSLYYEVVVNRLYP